jgi:aminoglycoside phosphotransferase
MDYVAYDGTAIGDEQPTSWTAVEQFLERSRRERNERLEQELAQIKAQLERRDAIHAEIVADLEWQVERYTEQLKRLFQQPTARDPRRDRVKDRIAAAEEALRDERRAHWRDRQDLEEAQREIHRELADLDDAVLLEFL